MVGLIGNLAKGALSKPKQKKVSPKQLVKDTGDKKERSKPKGSLVPSPSGAIVKIIDVKAPVRKDFVTGGDPALEQMKIINTKTFDIIKALKGQQVAKKKRAKSKKNLFQWMSRKNREEDREEGKGALKIPLVGKIADSAGKRNEKTMRERVAGEIFDAYNNKGNAVKKREETHKMAEANRAFSHFRW